MKISDGSVTIMIRLMVGTVFLTEGIQKFLFPALLGVGRFTTIGIPWPEFTAPFVGVVEIACGAMLILGLWGRLAAIPLLIDILVAIYTTKYPFLMKHGFWGAMHESRVDFCMFCGLIFLLIAGPGRFSIDNR
jgi:uncharacterized membrane protein YphA (DoxX/SURF4 family)